LPPQRFSRPPPSATRRALLTCETSRSRRPIRWAVSRGCPATGELVTEAASPPRTSVPDCPPVGGSGSDPLVGGLALAVEAGGVDLEQHRDSMPQSPGDRGDSNLPRSAKKGRGSMAEIVRPASQRRRDLFGCQGRITGSAPLSGAKAVLNLTTRIRTEEPAVIGDPDCFRCDRSRSTRSGGIGTIGSSHARDVSDPPVEADLQASRIWGSNPGGLVRSR
jgi:hypothetical protein